MHRSQSKSCNVIFVLFFFLFATLYCLRLKTELFRIHSSLLHLKSKPTFFNFTFDGRRLEILVDPFPRVNPKVAWPKAILSYISLFYYNLRIIKYKLKHVNGDRIQFNTSSVHTYLAIPILSIYSTFPPEHTTYKNGSEGRRHLLLSLYAVSLFRLSSFTCGSNTTTSFTTKYLSPQLKSSVMLIATSGLSSLLSESKELCFSHASLA